MATRFSTLGSYPTTRMRRNRGSDWSRRLVAENQALGRRPDLAGIRPGGPERAHPGGVDAGRRRLTIDLFVEAAKEARDLGIPGVAIFPETDPAAKTTRRTRGLQSRQPGLPRDPGDEGGGAGIGIVRDVALDPFNSDGHDGIVRDGIILNDESVEALIKQAIVQTEAGADVRRRPT